MKTDKKLELKSLSPTAEVFAESVKRAHIQTF